MSATKAVPVLAALALAACTGNLPPITSPPPFATYDYPPGATEEQGGAKTHAELKEELARIDAELAQMSGRLQVADGGAKKEELQQQLVILQSREDDLETQLAANANVAEAQAGRAHRQIQRGIMVLDGDTQKLERRIAPGAAPSPP